MVLHHIPSRPTSLSNNLRKQRGACANFSEANRASLHPSGAPSDLFPRIPSSSPPVHSSGLHHLFLLALLQGSTILSPCSFFGFSSSSSPAHSSGLHNPLPLSILQGSIILSPVCSSRLHHPPLMSILQELLFSSK